MVRIQEQSEYDRLDALIRELVAKHEYFLDVTGWTRRTYDVFRRNNRHEPRQPLARIESFASTNGEVTVYEDLAMGFAQELAESLEKEFELSEAVIVRQTPPA